MREGTGELGKSRTRGNDGVNEIALLLDEALQHPNESSGQMQGSQMCENPGGSGQVKVKAIKRWGASRHYVRPGGNGTRRRKRR